MPRCARCRTTRRAARRSRSPTLGRCTAVELQWEFLRLARKYADETGLEACGGDERRRARCSTAGSRRSRALERDPFELDGQLDWVTKLNLLRAYVDRDGLAWDDPKLALLDLQYHDVRPDRSLYERLVRAGKVERLVDEADVLEAMAEPPANDPGLFPGPLPRPLGRLRGRGQLGQPHPRRRLRPAAKNPDDGADAW